MLNDSVLKRRQVECFYYKIKAPSAPLFLGLLCQIFVGFGQTAKGSYQVVTAFFLDLGVA